MTPRVHVRPTTAIAGAATLVFASATLLAQTPARRVATPVHPPVPAHPVAPVPAPAHAVATAPAPAHPPAAPAATTAAPAHPPAVATPPGVDPGNAPPPPEGLFDYVVRPGDSCGSISQRFFSDRNRENVIHHYNAMGPVPHHLVPGQILHLPRGRPAARLTFVRNRVETYTPTAHPGHVNDALHQGDRVGTLERSSAEVSFADETRLQLAEQTVVMILGASSDRTVQQATALDATLVNGSLRAHLAQLSGAAANQPRVATAVTVTTSAGTVDVGDGDVQVSVDAHRATRLAVYHGHSSLVSHGSSVVVPEGFGSRADEGHGPTAPRMLPTVPTWVHPPSETVLLAPETTTADATGEFRAGAGAGPRVVQWHLQFARDARFNDLVMDTRVPANVVHLEARALPAGTYFARVSGVDAEHFEGEASAVAEVHVVPTHLNPGALSSSGNPGRLTTVDVPPAMSCTVDNGTAYTSGSIALAAAHDHVLVCRLVSDRAVSTTVNIPARLCGPIASQVRVEPGGMIATGQPRLLVLTLADATGAPLVRAHLDVVANGNVPVGPMYEHAAEPGLYSGSLPLEPVDGVQLRIVVNRDAETLEQSWP